MSYHRVINRFAGLLFILIACTSFGTERVKLTDDQLRARIVGVWFAEDMKELTMHVAQRMQYYPDGHFVGDFRISGPGNERYLRTLGVWSVKDGKFSETAQKTSDPEITFPTFFRYVVVIDSKHMTLGIDDGSQMEWFRGTWPLESGTPTLLSVDHKKLFDQFFEMHLSGYREVPDGKGSVSFRLDSRILKSKPSK
jgi:hypothetical protein